MSKECNVSGSVATDLNLVSVRNSPHGDYRPDPADVPVHNPRRGLFRASFPPIICLMTVIFFDDLHGNAAKGPSK